VKRCAGAGGCRLECELCSSSADCCSGACTNGRCAPMGCGALGESCGKSADCCSATCAASNGVLRCQTTASCLGTGVACAYSGQCCAGACRPEPDLQCRTGCASLGTECSSHDDCCGMFSDCMRLAGKLQCAEIIR
jgi:hypothetical protein